MTDNQKFGLYLPVWQRLWSCRFKIENLKLAEVIEQREEEMRGWPEPAGPLGLQVICFARQLAAARRKKHLTLSPSPQSGEGKSCCAITAEDLRHACTIAATGKESSKHLNNGEVNRVVTLMRLLIDPDDLSAVTDWLHPENAQARGLVAMLRKQAPEGLLRTIFRNAYGTSDWEDGNRQQLVWLLKQVKGRKKTWRQPVKQDLELEPF